MLQGHNIIPCWRNDISLSHLSHPVTVNSADKTNQQLQQLYAIFESCEAVGPQKRLANGGRFGVVPWERETTQSEETILDSDCITYNSAPGPNALLDSAAVHRSFEAMFLFDHEGQDLKTFFSKRH